MLALLLGAALGQEAMSAQEREVEDLFEAAYTLYEQGEYESAEAGFREVLARSGEPELYYNIANALERQCLYGEAQDALRAYRPNATGQEAMNLDLRIAALGRRLGRVTVEPAKKGPRWPLVVAGVGAMALGSVAAKRTYDLAIVAQREDDRDRYGTMRGLNGTSWVVVGVGGVGLGIGLFLPRRRGRVDEG